MTRKDYVLLAAALAAVRPEPKHPHYLNSELCAKHTLWGDTVASVAQALQRDNARFDLERFVRACEDGPKA